MKKALISGCTGQDGSYLAELLLEKGYEVHGLIRRSSSFNTARIDHLYKDPHDPDCKLHLHFADMTDGAGLRRAISKAEPDEIYNLACQSHVAVSFEQPVYTADTVAMGTLRLLEAIADLQIPVKLYQAGSSEMFGDAPAPQNELTPFRPRSPYAAAKVHAHWAVVNARERGLFACNGILYNHESERRGETFVTRKITRAATRIALGLQDRLYLGRISPKRDWGYAPDYVRAMWMMLQQGQPDDYVIATGRTHSVRDFIAEAFDCVGLGWLNCVSLDVRYDRPTEVKCLCGDAAKAREVLGWSPTVDFKGLVRLMIESDAKLAAQEKVLDTCEKEMPDGMENITTAD